MSTSSPINVLLYAHLLKKNTTCDGRRTVRSYFRWWGTVYRLDSRRFVFKIPCESKSISLEQFFREVCTLDGHTWSMLQQQQPATIEEEKTEDTSNEWGIGAISIFGLALLLFGGIFGKKWPERNKRTKK